jgi:hypothetical protein
MFSRFISSPYSLLAFSHWLSLLASSFMASPYIMILSTYIKPFKFTFKNISFTFSLICYTVSMDCRKLNT